jgi:hypothetical protein
MKDPVRLTSRRPARLRRACVLLACGTGTAALLASGAARAAPCGPATPAGTPCTLTGTLGVNAGALNLTSPTALAWATTQNGNDLQVVDPTVAHQSYVVNDATGSGAGWHVTVSATTFTSGANKLPDAGTFQTNGSTSAETAITAPIASCSTAVTCVLPVNTTTYPVAITTAPAAPPPVTIYDTSAGTGLGSITIGVGANPVGWWVNVPSNARSGTYTATVSLQVLTGP